jgi:hypothetical protein
VEGDAELVGFGMYLAPLNCFLHDPLPEDAVPVYDADPGSAVVYVGEDRRVVRQTVPDDRGDEMYGRVKVPLLELGVQELAALAETVLLEAAGERGSGMDGAVRTTACGHGIVTMEPEYMGRLATKDGRSGLLIYNVEAVWRA